MVKNIPDGTDSGVAYTTGQSSSDVFQWFSMEGALTLQTSQSTNTLIRKSSLRTSRWYRKP